VGRYFGKLRWKARAFSILAGLIKSIWGLASALGILLATHFIAGFM
jgi:hypothetical protein